MGSLTDTGVKDEGVWATSVALRVGHMSAVGKVMMMFPGLGPAGTALGTGALGKVIMRFPWLGSNEFVRLFAATWVFSALLPDLFLHVTFCFFETGLTLRAGSTFWLASLGRRGGRRRKASSMSLVNGGGLDRVVACKEGTRGAFFLDVAATESRRGLRTRAEDSGRLGG